MKSFQEQNEAILLNLWQIGETAFDSMLAKVSKQVAKVERSVWLGPCQLETGYEYPCHRTAVVTDIETGVRTCSKCFRRLA